MSTIPASYIVAINPRLIPAGGTDLEFNGLFLTENDLISADAPVMAFTSAETVKEFFGETSAEYSAAVQYFLGYNNSFAKPRRLMFGRRISAAVGAWIRGGKFIGNLAQIQGIISGTFDIEINGTPIALTGLDFSAVTSYSDAATVLETALDAELTGVTVAYSSLTGAFQINSPATGATETITASSGTVANLLNLTEAAGATLSQGSDALTQTQNMDKIKAASQNWVCFTTLYTATDDEHLGLSAWASAQGIEYLYVGWTADARLLVQGGTADIASQIEAAEYGATELVYDNVNVAAFVLGCAASINWERYQGTINFAFKHADGLAATVTDETTAALLDAKNVAYVGKFATRNDNFTFLYPAAMFGRYGFIDAFINTIWLKNVMQVSVMNGLTNAGRVPYNDRGYALIRAWLQDPVNRAVNNGCIDPGVTLSESQKAQIYNETGKDLTTELWTKGYAILVEDAGAAVRVGRQSPNISVYYTYGGSVNRIEVASTAVL
jgi:hypothetical protein